MVTVYARRKSLSIQKMRSAKRGSKKGWVPVTGKIPPQSEAMLADLETKRQQQRTDLIYEAVDMLLVANGYTPSQAAA